MTRGQLAAMLLRAMDYQPRLSETRFLDDDGHIFETALSTLAAEGVIKGCNPPANTHSCPDELLTRGQLAGVLKRALS